MSSINGIYDVLFIGKMLQQKVEDFSEGEIQLFSYLACLLSIYDGRNASSWGYIFIKNSYGSPYSNEISSGFRELKMKGLLEDADRDSYYTITERGSYFFNQITNHSQNEERKKYLEVAMQMVNFFPYGVLTRAINDEPILKAYKPINLRRNLLDDDGSGQAILYDQFRMLKDAIKDNNGLLTPAYIWLNSLAFYDPKITYEHS